jgi:hypothetical protein
MTNASRSLLPREHGAYAELIFPLLTGLILGRPSIAAFGFTLAAVLAFLSYEPLAVITGVRGARLREELEHRATRRLVVLAAGCVGTAALAFTMASTAGRLAALAPMVCGILLVPAALTGRVKSLVNELLVAATLAATLLPVAVSGGVPARFAAAAGAVWFVGFALATLTVHAIKARIKPDTLPQWPLLVAPAAALAVIAVGATVPLWTALPWLMGAALLPSALGTLVISVMRVHPRRLRYVGWSLVSANLLTAVLVVAAA